MSIIAYFMATQLKTPTLLSPRTLDQEDHTHLFHPVADSTYKKKTLNEHADKVSKSTGRDRTFERKKGRRERGREREK